MRVALLAILLLTGCNSTVDVPSTEPERPRRCATSFGCAEGERCDDGECKPDVGCPPALSPKLLASTTHDLARIAVFGGHEYRLTKAGSVDVPTTSTVYTDLDDGTTLTFAHALGAATCAGPPAWCAVLSQGIETVFTQVFFDRVSGSIKTAAPVSIAEADVVVDLGNLPEFIVLDSQSAIKKLNVATQTTEVIVTLQKVELLPPLRRTLAGERKLVGLRKDDPTGWTLLEAPFVPGAAWAPFFTADGNGGRPLVIPAPDGWFVLVPSFDGTSIWRTGPEGTAFLGTIAANVLPNGWDAIDDVAARFGVGDQALADGSRGRAVGCGNGTCTSEEIDLAVPARKVLGSVTIPGAQSIFPTGERWLACDTVEVLLTADVPTEGPASPSDPDTQIFVARIPGKQ